jgi:hypothetical protein
MHTLHRQKVASLMPKNADAEYLSYLIKNSTHAVCASPIVRGKMSFSALKQPAGMGNLVQIAMHVYA